MSAISDDIRAIADELTCIVGLVARADAIANALSAERQRTDDLIEAMKRVLGPFAKAGHVIDGPFGPALFAEDDMAFKSGCAWSENGVSRTITWGDFRRARALLSKLEGR